MAVVHILWTRAKLEGADARAAALTWPTLMILQTTGVNSGQTGQWPNTLCLKIFGYSTKSSVHNAA